jgi:hypothetical protein
MKEIATDSVTTLRNNEWLQSVNRLGVKPRSTRLATPVEDHENLGVRECRGVKKTDCVSVV